MSISKKYANIRRYAANSSWLIMQQVLQIGLNVLGTVLVARHLGPAQFGVLSYAIAVVTLCSYLGHVGLPGIVIREVVKDSERSSIILGTAFVLKVFGYLCGIGVVSVFVVVAVRSEQDTPLMVLIVGASLIFRAVEVIEYWFESRLQGKLVALARMVGGGLGFAYRLVMVIAGASVVVLAWYNALLAAVTGVMLVILYTYKSGQRISGWRWNGAYGISLLRRGWLVFGGALIGSLYLRMDQIMLHWLVGPEEVGVYAVSSSCANAIGVIPAGIVASVFPRLIALKERDSVRYERRLQQSFDVLLGSGIALSLGLWFLVGPLINTILGETYLRSGVILGIHVWATPFVFMRALIRRWIHLENALFLSVFLASIGTIVNALSNFLLIPQFGGIGAAVATLISYAMSSYVVLLFHPKSRPLFFKITMSVIAPYRYGIRVLRRK